MDEYDAINSENCMLNDVCSELKKDIRTIERNKQELKHANNILESEKLKSNEKTLSISEELVKLKML